MGDAQREEARKGGIANLVTKIKDEVSVENNKLRDHIDRQVAMKHNELRDHIDDQLKFIRFVETSCTKYIGPKNSEHTEEVIGLPYPVKNAC